MAGIRRATPWNPVAPEPPELLHWGSSMSRSSPLIAVVHRYQQSSKLCWRELYARTILRRMNTELRLFLLGMCEERFVEDLLQEVYRAVFRKLKTFTGENDSQVWGWVRTIARRKVYDHYRKEARNPAAPNAEEPLEGILAESNPSLQVSAEEPLRLEEVLARLRRIDPVCVEHLWNRYVRGLSFAEMAQKQGVAYDTMRVRVSRCVEKLRRMGGDDQDL